MVLAARPVRVALKWEIPEHKFQKSNENSLDFCVMIIPGIWNLLFGLFFCYFPAIAF